MKDSHQNTFDMHVIKLTSAQQSVVIIGSKIIKLHSNCCLLN